MQVRGDCRGTESNRSVDPCEQFKDAAKVVRQIAETTFQVPHRQEQHQRRRPSVVAAVAAKRKRSCSRFQLCERAVEAAAQEQQGGAGLPAWIESRRAHGARAGALARRAPRARAHSARRLRRSLRDGSEGRRAGFDRRGFWERRSR